MRHLLAFLLTAAATYSALGAQPPNGSVLTDDPRAIPSTPPPLKSRPPALPTSPSDSEQSEAAHFERRIAGFHAEYERFLRTLQGCPLQPATPGDMSGCDRRRGQFDAKQWQRVRQEAKKTFK